MDFRVGSWLVRPRLNSLVHGGQAYHLTPKAMEVLVCLAKRQGEVVGKDEIFQEVWAGAFVSDDSLTRCIGELRRAFPRHSARAGCHRDDSQARLPDIGASHLGRR